MPPTLPRIQALIIFLQQCVQGIRNGAMNEGTSPLPFLLATGSFNACHSNHAIPNSPVRVHQGR